MSPRLRIGVIGAGRVGAVLASALRRAGHDVVAVAAVSDLSRLRAQALLPGVPILPSPEVVQDADLALLAVPDDTLPGLVAGLAEVGALHAGQFLVHTSGRHGLGVLAPVTGAVPLALHPVMTFTGTSIDLDRLADCPFGVTSPEGARPIAEALVVEMGGDPVWVPEEARARYHAAIAFGANSLQAVVLESFDALRSAGMSDPARLMGPLLSASLDNALRHGDAALTGPVARGDAETVAAHLSAMAEISPAAAAAHRAIGRLAAERALQAGLIDLPAAERLLAVLAERP